MNRFALYDAKGNFMNVINNSFHQILSISKSLKQPNLICELIGINEYIVRYVHIPNNIILNKKDHYKAVELIIQYNITPNYVNFEPIPEIYLN